MRKPMRQLMKKTAKKTISRAKGYKSAIKAAIHETASDLHELGLIDKQTMRRFDESCLTPVQDFTGKEIRALRERENVSQVVFARYLNVRKESITQWERGLQRPSGPTLKLLCLVQKKGLDAIA